MSEPGAMRGATDWQRVDALLAATLERPPAERGAFLQASCRDDPQLAQRVATLLEMESRAPAFLDGEAMAHALPFLAGGAQRLHEDAAPSTPAAGERLGAYRLVRELGRGGMSVVYLAERDDRSFQKQVAVKFIQPLLADAHFLRRFQDEREILARLEHPGIARILDGGETAHGIPYFVMEYVQGEPVDAYCEALRLDVDERLRLFVKIGEAVACAHQNLVVHRDLKPSNVLVTAGGDVKLLDFGIAKVLSGSAASAHPTLTGERLMTPAYASPEQVRGEPVRTVSDVYSLGVLLYEMLTGRLPYRGGAFAHQLVQAILEEEPLRPSAAVAQANPALARRLRGDLDVIVTAALRKQPERRYASADALIQDVRRHLAGEAVAARGDAWTYRLGTFARRRWPALTMAAAILAAAATSAVFHNRRVRSERDVARRERDKAAGEARKAQAVTDYLVSLFEASNPYASARQRADTLTARALLDAGTARIDRELGGQPEVRASLLRVLGTIHYQLALFDRAQTLYEEALALRRSVFGESHAAVAESSLDLGTLLIEKGEYARAEPLLRQAHALQVRLLGPESAPAAASLNELGRLLRQQGDLAGAERCLREALRIRRLVQGPDEAIAESLANLGLLRQQQGDLQESESLLRQALAIQRRRNGERHPETARMINNLAGALDFKGPLAPPQRRRRRASTASPISAAHAPPSHQ